jgi:hypothetical protein
MAPAESKIIGVPCQPALPISNDFNHVQTAFG